MKAKDPTAVSTKRRSALQQFGFIVEKNPSASRKENSTS
jgi:hypothetical protein